VIVANDFSNTDYFKRNYGHDEANNPTNEKLRELLDAAGIPVTKAPIADKDAPVYLTNSILCLKTGPRMNEPIRMGWVQECTRHHLVPLVRYLKAPVVVGMAVWVGARSGSCIGLRYGIHRKRFRRLPGISGPWTMGRRYLQSDIAAGKASMVRTDGDGKIKSPTGGGSAKQFDGYPARCRPSRPTTKPARMSEARRPPSDHHARAEQAAVDC
jgi:hypothetical protein